MALGVGSIVVGAGTGYALDELRDKAADPSDDSPAAAVVRGACDIHSSTGYGYLAGGIGTGLALDGFCRPYYQQQGIDPPSLDSPFQGGQCPTPYSFVRMRNSAGGATQFFTAQNQPGPYSDFQETKVPNGPTNANWFWSITDGNGVVHTTSALNLPASLTWEVEFTNPTGDDCGDPPDVVSPGPNNPGRQPGVPYSTTVFGDSYNITVNEQTDVNNNPVLEVTLDVGGVQVGPKYAFNPAVEVSVPVTPSPPSVVGEPVDTTDPGGDIDDDISPEELNEGFETIGYRWQFSSVPANRGEIPATTPTRFFPVFASLQLKYENEGGLTFYSDVLKIDTAEGSLIRPDASLKVTGVSYNRKTTYGPMILVPVRARKAV